MNTYDYLDGTEIAVIGMVGRFPGARNLDEFWQNLCDGVEAIHFPDDGDLEALGVDAASLRDPNYVKAATGLDGMDLFDATFFGYTPREAELMDPQHRIFLECAWEALERAGYDPKTCGDTVGVFAGATTNTYLLLNLLSNPQVLSTLDPVQIDVGNAADHLATRVSYKLNLKGPSYTVQTACSTSLVAVHLACRSLLNDECDTALAGGISVHVKHPTGYRYQEGSIVSPDGHCRAFDAQANGTVFGSGVGVVVLRRLEDAIPDGDSIHAIIKGSAINNDGAVKVGYTAPSVEGQAAVITEALAVADVEADTVSYVETHGTGTQMGDPIEIRALTKAFVADTDRKDHCTTASCAIASVKTNIGHLAGAAGIASLIKAVLALENKCIPPSINFDRPNPEIDFVNSPFFVNTELADWKTDATPRRAGVSSFGVGGTNAHVVLEEAPALQMSGPSRPAQLLLLSAKTGTALDAATANLANYLGQPNINLADTAYTLQVGRQAFRHRRMMVCRDLGDAIDVLETRDPQRLFNGAPEIQERLVAFAFTGQGAQYVNMALELYQAEPVFREQVNACSKLLRPDLGLDLRTLLYPDAQKIGEAEWQLSQTAITQPALFVIEYALAQLWMSWGVQPRTMIGHSIGEYVAACLAGVFSLKDALALVAARGRLMQSLPAGSMVSVFLPEEKVRPLLGSELSLAAVNAPSLSVVSGSTPAIKALQGRLDEGGEEYRPLRTSHAFHSEMMDPILESFVERVGQTKLNPPQIPYISNVTGTWIEAAEATTPDYWGKHLRQTVRFGDGIHQLMHDPTQVLLEVGPGNTLTKLAKSNIDNARSRVALASIRHPRDQQSDVEFLLTTLGKLWLAGVTIDWPGLCANERRRRLPLPTYPFERQRYWIEAGTGAYAATAPSISLYKKADLSDWFYIPVWKSSPPPRPFKPADDEGIWLLFVDGHALGVEMVKRLREAGQKVVTVKVGERFGRVGDGAYTLDPRSRDDYAVLLEEIGTHPYRIVHLWSLTPNHDTQSGVPFFDRCQDLGFYSLLFLAQALGKTDVTEPTCIEVVSDHIHSVIESEPLLPEKSTILGACKVIPQEYPSIACRCTDVVVPEPGTPQSAKLIDQLCGEINTQADGTTLAYRGGQRWVQTFEPAPLKDENEPLRPLRPKGVYLVTGGLSGIGLDLATYLAKTVQARLILIGEEAQSTESVSALEELGSQVLVINADVADETQMQAAITEAEARFGPINGVIHAAGVIGEKAFRPIQDTDYVTCNWHFEPKVHGLFTLERVLRDQSLDFCLLNSSLSSVLGGVGYAAFAAADLFMDAFAQKQNKMSRFLWISVNWDAWRLEEEVEQITAISTDLAQLALSPAEGGETLRRVLAASTAERVVVSTGDLATRVEQGRQKIQALRDQTDPQHRTLYERPDLGTDYVPPRNEVEHKVIEIWQQVLGIEEIGVHDNFFDLGGHSLLATQLRSHLYEAFKIELAIRDLFENATVAGVAQLIESSRDQATGDEEKKPIAERLRAAFPTERQDLLKAYIRPKVAQALSLKIDQIPQDGSLAEFDLELVAVDLMWNLKRDLELQFYPHEITARPSIQEIARFVLAEFERRSDLTALATSTPLCAYKLKPYRKRTGVQPLASSPTKKNKSMVFLHSSPRAGSTLLRVMLAGHANLFCPPELNILFFEDMQEWRQNIGFGHDFQWTAQGVHWAFVELLGLASEEGWTLLDDMVGQNRSVQSVYAELQDMSGERLLVDKTPPYSMDVETLERAEALFDTPKYIYLVRHPYAVIESLLRVRLDRLFAPSLFEDDDIDPYIVAETVWALCNCNLLRFFEQIEPARYHLVRYEDLVSDPARIMADLCQFLDVPFDATLLDPYDGRRERMMGGLGDPNIFQHDRIDPSLGEAWRNVNLPRRLDESTKELAMQLGYEWPEIVGAPAADFSGLAEEQVLDNLDDLSDEQVYAMLSNMFASAED